MASILAFLTALFEGIKELGSLLKLILPTTSEKIDDDKSKIDDAIKNSDETGRP
jgi:hypothetical protein